jgi:hypothetical protein
MKVESLLLVSSLLLSATSMLACGGQGEVRKTGGTYAGRGPGCEYRVIRNPLVDPVPPYEEIGVIDVDAFAAQQLPNDEERFRRVVGPKVCALGGHAVIPAINIYGRWIHATVIRFNPAQCDRCDVVVHTPPGVIVRPTIEHMPVVGDIVRPEGG